MTEENPSPDETTFGDRLYLAFLSFLRALVRLTLIVFVAVGIGLVIYLAVPRLYDRFVQPIEENSLAIEDLQARQSQDSGLLLDRLDEMQIRIDTLELQNDQDKELIAESRAQLDELEAFFSGQIDGISVTLTGLEEIDTRLVAIEEDLDRLDGSILAVSGEVAANQDSIESNRLQSESLEATFAAAENPLNSLRKELQLVKVMELITRSRIFLAQQNLGLVEEDLQLAGEILTVLETQVPDYQRETLRIVIARIDLALENLPDNLDLVENDLEVAWQILVVGLPAEPGQEPAPAETPDSTPTPLLPTPTATPTS